MLEVKQDQINSKLAQYEAGLFYADSTITLYRAIAKNLLESPQEVIKGIKSKSRWLQVKTVANRLNKLGLANIQIPPWKKRTTTRADHIKKRTIDDRLFEMIYDDLPSSEKGNQLRLAILLAYTAGLKVDEVLNLKSSDMKVNKRIEIAVTGKDTSARIAIVAAKEQELRNELLNRIHSFKSFSITSGYIKNALHRVSNRLGIQFSFQDFRHAYALRLYDEGLSLLDIKDLLGLKDPKTTMVYLDINPKRTMEKLEKLGY
jgi:integrase